MGAFMKIEAIDKRATIAGCATARTWRVDGMPPVKAPGGRILPGDVAASWNDDGDVSVTIGGRYLVGDTPGSEWGVATWSTCPYEIERGARPLWMLPLWLAPITDEMRAMGAKW